MPQLDELLAKALQKEPKKTFTRGNRPDRIASGYLLESPLGSEKSEAKVEPEPEPKVEPKRSQSEAKVETKVESMSHSSLVVGLQKKALIFLYDSCRFSGSKISPPFAIQNIADACGTSISATKKALQRLEQKQILRRVEYKDGRSGWTRYQLPDAIYNAMLHDESRAKAEPNRSQSRAKVGTKVEPEPEPSASSSSSSLKDLETTTTDEAEKKTFQDLNPLWTEIDFEDLNGIRFGRSHVVQIARDRRLTPEELQDSIYAFAFDLDHNSKAKGMTKPPLNYFMGILRKGPYAPPANYEPPEVRQTRLYLEAKEREQKIRAELESRLENVEFDEWARSLTAEERTRLVPATDFAKPGSQGHNVQLKQYFREKLWPEVREKVLRKGTTQGVST